MRHLSCLAGVAALFVAVLPSAAQTCLLPPSPHAIDELQPDGTSIRLYLRGAGRHTWHEDAEGYPVVRRAGLWVYATASALGGLSPTGFEVGRVDPRALGLLANVTPLPPSGFGQPTPLVSTVHPTLNAPGGGLALGPGSTTVKNLVVLLRFSNHGPGGQNRTLPSNGDVDVIMNQVGGDPTLAPTGSVRDHYIEDSYNQLLIDSTVVGWLDVPNSESYYANGNSGLTSLTWDLIIDGLNLADPLVDFSQYDQDGDGWIDAITFLHSGYGAEWGGTDQYGTFYTDRMWSHKWTIPTWTSAEGVRVGDYNISPGLWSTSGSSPGRIGVVCHELGHFFGMPDLYDTDGSSQGIGNWCLMAAGSWGFDGSQYFPSHMSAWAKAKMGWLLPTPILPGSFVAAQVETNASVFRVDNGYPPGEYLLIENRQPTGFDLVIPQGGLAIWHVDDAKGSMGANDPNTDEGYPGQAGWPGNGRHYRSALLQADGAFDMEQGSNRGDGGDIYHGAGASQISPTTNPDTDRYQGGSVVNNGNQITNIGLSSANVAFDYVNPSGPSIATASLPPANVGVAYSQSLSGGGGTAPLQWSEYVATPGYNVTDLGSSQFANVGSAQNWRADEDTWTLALPFPFPFYETVYDTVYVSSNGFLDFVPGEPEPFNTSLALKVSLRIAPIWDDLRTDGTGRDIFVDSQSDEVTIRWRARTANGNQSCNFSVTLHDDGRVQFNYGSGNNGLSPTVGISRGQGGDFELVAGYDQTGSLTSANSVLFTRTGSLMPPGLTLAPNGSISGTPTVAGTYAPHFRLEDAAYLYDERTLTISVGNFVDCNNNGVDDAQDIATGTSLDCNSNGIPDECELVGNDCNGNGVPDECDTDCNGNGTPDDCETFTDCNSNGIPDECELVGNDCNGNGVPDECDTDCNGNGTPDDCETFTDCNSNGIPDECELVGNDCNGNGVPDECDTDCNGNGTPDDCETFTDCNSNGIPDECEVVGNDCNGNGVPDECDTDCNGNGTPDDCETFTDCNSNGIPDECELVGNDCNGNGVPDECDTDCNGNGTPDDCETFTDCNSNGIPDECELVGNDCNGNGVPDECDTDCNGNGTPDDCETFTDCNSNGIPDECELVGNDCNGNGVPDECDTDCNGNGTPDDCETFTDCNSNGIPDECELVGNDCNGNGVPDECDTDCNGNGTPDDCETFPDCNANGIPDECEPGIGISFYCTGKTNSLGCVPFLTTTGGPSVSDPTPFRIVANDVVPSEVGFMVYSSQKANLNFHGGKLCVKSPFKRTAAKTPKSGAAGCTAEQLRFNFNARIQGGLDPLLTVGQSVRAQWFQRDPGNPSGFADSLTNGVAFTICQ